MYEGVAKEGSYVYRLGRKERWVGKRRKEEKGHTYVYIYLSTHLSTMFLCVADHRGVH